jgi:hypothetical protein
MKTKMPSTTRGCIRLFTLGLLLSGCAQMNAGGAVAMKVSAETAHVSLGAEEVSEGDAVTLYRNQCERSPRASSKTALSKLNCTRIRIGEGTVTEVLNENYSVVAVSPGTSFEEGDEVKLTR